jgi:hypothetical protein
LATDPWRRWRARCWRRAGSGEGAECFSRFLDNALGGDPPGSPILCGPPDAEDARASPDFTELFEQRRYFLREERAPEQARL